MSPSSAPPLAPKREFVALVPGFGPFPQAPPKHIQLLTKHLRDHLSMINQYNSTGLSNKILNPTAADGKFIKCESLGVVFRGRESVQWKVYSNWWGAREKEEYYLVPDAEGKTVGIFQEGREGDVKRYAVGVPGLMLGFLDDVKKVVNYGTDDKGKGKEEIKVDVISHDEAGYACGLISYESLATGRRRKLNTRVVFCHVSEWKEEEERLERGADFAYAVVGAVYRQINPSFPDQVMYQI